MSFGVSKYFPNFFTRQNIAEAPLERNSILRECLGKTLLGLQISILIRLEKRILK